MITNMMDGCEQDATVRHSVINSPVIQTKRYMTRMILSPIRPGAIPLALKISKCRCTDDLRGLLDAFEKSLINTKGRFFAMSVRDKAESLLNHRSSKGM